MNLNPEYYGLNKQVKLIKLDEAHLAIVKKIKSRIIMKDAQLVLQRAYTILDKDPLLKVSFICTSNICSKSLTYLKNNNIEVFIED